MVTALVSRRAQTIAEHQSGCRFMFKNKENSQLELMYRCFQRDKSQLALSPIINFMKEYIEESAKKFVEDMELASKPIQFIDELIAFKTEIDSVVKDCFKKNVNFERGRDSSFREFMRK
jgi:hypothetical protein